MSDLTAGCKACQGVGNAQPEVIVCVNFDWFPGHLFDPRDEVRIGLRVHYAKSICHRQRIHVALVRDLANQSPEYIEAGPRRVDCEEGHIQPMSVCVVCSLDCEINRFALTPTISVFDEMVAGRYLHYETIDVYAQSIVYIRLHAACEREHLRPKAEMSNLLKRLRVFLGNRGQARLNSVHSSLVQRASDSHLLTFPEDDSRLLLPVP